eukprot:CAMPEP_0194596792 /NCGR_PEP_ID=MMETSP0292-20121207/25894_1 /TAXON_ID=39354 /ORGANISM="Heterosigma akashiwo, Strain CCMP2393" /LENGTH=89 /DNA_ID=CAMNT_0039457169 /DNA_START=244 /DNA_END=510 /DNA_ORIENTATION=-
MVGAQVGRHPHGGLDAAVVGVRPGLPLVVGLGLGLGRHHCIPVLLAPHAVLALVVTALLAVPAEVVATLVRLTLDAVEPLVSIRVHVLQ